ncbi:MAG TPA: SCO family protein [Balneolaceae bacterium]|nr:SCO family protein [Balneolaceae bacterium]
MKKTLGILFLMLLIILPVGLVIGFSYAGSSHPIEHTVLKHDAFLKKSSNDVEILFFGFAGCAVVCPVSLGKMGDVLDSDAIKNGHQKVGGLFVEVKSTLDETGDDLYADRYSRGFSKNIRGYTPDLETYQQMAHEFILRVYENRNDSGQISHTDHFFILVRKGDTWVIERVLKNNIETSHMVDIVSRASNI